MSGSFSNTRRKPCSARELVERGARVGDRDEVRAVAAERSWKYVNVRQRLDRPARLRRDDEQRLVEVERVARSRGLRRVRSSRARAARMPSGRRRTSGAAPRAPRLEPPMPEQHGVGEARRPCASRELVEVGGVLEHASRLIVSQPSRLAISGTPARPQSVSSCCPDPAARRRSRRAVLDALDQRRLELVGQRGLDRRRAAR